MGNIKASNLMLISNILSVPEDKRIVEYYPFMKDISDPAALEYIKLNVIDNMYSDNYRRFTDVQHKIYSNTSRPCSNAKDKEKRPWGIRKKGDKIVVVCKCDEYDCIKIAECRKDLSREEIKKLTEKKLQEEKQACNIEDAQEFKEKPLEWLSRSSKNDFSVANNKDSEENSKEHVDEKDCNIILTTAQRNKIKECVKNSESLNFEEVSYRSTNKKSSTSEIEKERPEESDKQPNNNREEQRENSGDFHKRLSVARKITQEEYLAEDSIGWHLINAGPGTGKTEALARRVVILLQDPDIENENILVLCYSRAACQEVRNRIMTYAEKYNLQREVQNINIRTLDSFAGWMLHILKYNQNNELKIQVARQNRTICDPYARHIVQATETIVNNPELLEDVQYFIVDEIQDLVGYRAEFVLKILMVLAGQQCGVTLLGDFCQAIYDYQVQNDKTLMSSAKFYQRLSENFTKRRWEEFTSKFRMSAEKVKFLENIRDMLKKGQDFYGFNGILEHMDIISGTNIDEELATLSGENVAVLTRNNAEALRISDILSNNSIRHELSLKRQGLGFDRNIADFFYAYNGKRLNEMRFRESVRLMNNCIDDEEIQYHWQLIKKFMDEDNFEIYDLLKAIKNDYTEANRLFSFRKSKPNVLVMNVHRAKGREFENVWLLDSLLKKDNFEKNNEEARITYVALSRSKKDITSIKIKEKKMWEEYNAHGRYISWLPPQGKCNKDSKMKIRRRRTKRNGRLDCFEFLPVLDILPEGFSNKEVQEFIRECDNVEEHSLEIILDTSSNTPKYYLADSDNPERKLAYLSDCFMEDYKIMYTKSARNQDNNFEFLPERDYPTRFSGLMANKVVSFIGELSDENIDVPEYDNLAVWYGLEPVGLIKAHWDDMH